MATLSGEPIQFLGLIPARGGSKGIPRKNITPVLGKPLIAWTIEAAKASHRLDRVVVSTEDPDIAAVAREEGCEVLERPPDLATDDSDTLDVLQHAVEQIPAHAVVLLQPTSPIRDEGLIDRCIDRFVESECDSLATGLICKSIEYGKNDLNRQDIEGFFYDDGNVYVIRADMLARSDRYGQKVERVIVDKEQNTDIDDEFDLWAAQQILLRRQGRL
jgi:CMP-N-acetylneuraminic acid synthetase